MSSENAVNENDAAETYGWKFQAWKRQVISIREEDADRKMAARRHSWKVQVQHMPAKTDFKNYTKAVSVQYVLIQWKWL